MFIIQVFSNPTFVTVLYGILYTHTHTHTHTHIYTHYASGWTYTDDNATPVEFAVEYEHRNAEKFDRMEVINAFVGTVKTPPHKVCAPGRGRALVFFCTYAC